MTTRTRTRNNQRPRQYGIELDEKQDTFRLYGHDREIFALGKESLPASVYLQWQTECNLWGCLLLADSVEAWSEMRLLLDEESFTHPALKAMFRDVEAWSQGKHEDAELLYHAASLTAEGVRMTSYCLDRHAASPAHLRYYSRLVYEAHRKRQYDEIIQRDRQRKASGTMTAMELKGALASEMETWEEADLLSETESIADDMLIFMSDLEVCMTTEKSSVVYSGVAPLDDHLGGFMESDYIILAGRPGTGKTSLAMNTVEHICENGGACVVYSLEMTKKQLIARLIQQQTGVSAKWLLTGDRRLFDHLHRIQQATHRISQWNLKVYDHAGLEEVDCVPALTEKARRSMGVEKIDLVVFDHLGEATKNAVDKQAETTRKSGILRNHAKHSGVPVLNLVQMNRGIEKAGKSEDGKLQRLPQISDLRDAGEIEEQASVILFTHNQEQIVIGKDRFGSTDVVDCDFNGQYTRWGR